MQNNTNINSKANAISKDPSISRLLKAPESDFFFPAESGNMSKKNSFVRIGLSRDNSANRMPRTRSSFGPI